jgi:DNA-binding response OmpR family regulator
LEELEPVMNGGNRGRVLVVEDDEDTTRASVVDLIRSEVSEFDGVAAENGYDALQLLLDGLDPSLIVLDLMMPEMDGFEFLKCLDMVQELPPAVIIITGRSEAWGGLTHPAVKAHFGKPLSPNVLLAAVRQHCSRAAEPDSSAGIA